jgi:hypothetical protein
MAAIRLGETVVVADQGAAADAVDFPAAEMTARCVMGQVTGLGRRVTGAEPFVVTLDDPPGVAHDVQAVMRLVAAAELVRRAGNRPYPEPAAVFR